MREATLVATLTEPPSPRGDELRALPPAVRCLEVRADQIGDISPDWLRSHFHGELLYTLRGRERGGHHEGSTESRTARLVAAARGYDLVNLEWEGDARPDVLDRIPADRRLLSTQGPMEAPAELRGRYAHMARVEARHYRMEVAVSSAVEALAPLALLKAVQSQNLTAYATGPAGFYSRIIAPLLGAPFVFGSATGDDLQRGELGVERLANDYRLPAVPEVHTLFGIVGVAALKSSSPQLHNAAYRALGLSALYLPFYAERFEHLFCDAVKQGFESLGMPLMGMTVMAPHKEVALRTATSAHPIATRVGAANALFRRGTEWRADTTDAVGVTAPLLARGVRIQGAHAVVVGCGGAGRAAAEGLKQAGADVTLCNRSHERGQLAGRLLGLPVIPLSEFSARKFAIVVHATPCVSGDGEHPIRVEDLDPDAVLVDLVYRADPTPLVTAVRARGNTVIDGREVLLVEVRRQFRLMTGRSMPWDPARAPHGLTEDQADLDPWSAHEA